MRWVVISLSLVVSAAAQQPALRDYGRLPLVFEPNRGQTDPAVRFLARTGGGTLFLTDGGAVFGSVRIRLSGANKPKTVQGLEPTGGISNYFIGADPAKWRTAIPHYSRVEYKSVYAGVDLVYYGNPQKLEYDFNVAPGADPRAIQVEYDGVESLRVDQDGDLVLKTADGELRQKRPLAYQETEAGRVEVAVEYRLKGRRVAFELARYDAARRLVIDPVFFYSTYLGGSANDEGHGIAVDGSGNAYVTGQTASTNFPTSSPLQASNGGGNDVFVVKINNLGNALVYSTYLGGSGNSGGYAIAVDSSGNAYLTGYTASTTFPTSNPLQASHGGGTFDAFATKINAAGSARVYSTYLGGSGDDIGYGIAVDSSGNAYLTGTTASTNFPTASPLQASNGGNADAFLAKINTAGSALVYSTYLGGSGGDRGNAIAVDGSGAAYVTGQTFSTNFPTTNPLQASHGGGLDDAFVTKVNAAGSARAYSTYLGGNGSDNGQGIAVDGSGNAYLAGYTASTTFPTSNPLQANHGGGTFDVFVTKINAAGSARTYSSYLGGSGDEPGYGIAVDGSGNAYVTGLTGSTNFPTTNPLQASNGGGSDVFVLSLSGNSAVGVFRDTNGSIRLTSELSTVVSNSFGVFASDPSASQNARGDTFVVARDSSNAVWVNVYDARTRTWDGWTSAGASVQGMPAVAAFGSNTAYIVARDASNAYWTNTYTRGAGFNGWTNIGGVFATDPVIGARGDAYYIVGKDSFNAIWIKPGVLSWALLGAVVQGKPSVTVGSDSAAYIGIRDPSNAVWMGRHNGATFDGWQPGGATIANDPQVAATSNVVYAAALASSGAVWYNTFTQGTGNNWTGWVNAAGTLSSLGVAATTGPQLFLTGRDAANQLWWYETPGAGWKFVGAAGVAAGPLSAAPR